MIKILNCNIEFFGITCTKHTKKRISQTIPKDLTDDLQDVDSEKKQSL